MTPAPKSMRRQPNRDHRAGPVNLPGRWRSCRACRFAGGWHPTPSRTLDAAGQVHRNGSPRVAAAPRHANSTLVTGWHAARPTTARASMKVRLGPLKLYKIVAAPVRVRRKGASSGEWHEIIALSGAGSAGNGRDFSTSQGASRSCALDPADPLIRPCQTPPGPAPTHARPAR